MKKIISLLLLSLVLSGCTWFSKGLDVCQDDSCFIELATEAMKEGDIDRATEFCEAILSQELQTECLEMLP